MNGGNLLITVPLAAQSASTATLMTASGMSCPAKTDCGLHAFCPGGQSQRRGVQQFGKSIACSSGHGHGELHASTRKHSCRARRPKAPQSLKSANQPDQQQHTPDGDHGRERDRSNAGVHRLQLRVL